MFRPGKCSCARYVSPMPERRVRVTESGAGRAQQKPRNYGWRGLLDADRLVEAAVSRMDFTAQDMGDLMLASRQLKAAVGPAAAAADPAALTRAVACAWVRSAAETWSAWVPAICPAGTVADASLVQCGPAPPAPPAPARPSPRLAALPPRESRRPRAPSLRSPSGLPETAPTNLFDLDPRPAAGPAHEHPPTGRARRGADLWFGPRGHRCQPCPAGRVCLGGTDLGRPCPAGYYCPGNSSQPTACPGGRASAEEGAARAADCGDCAGGWTRVGAGCVPTAALLGSVLAAAVALRWGDARAREAAFQGRAGEGADPGIGPGTANRAGPGESAGERGMKGGME